MSALDLDALERRARKGLVLSPDETLALITRLRAAELRAERVDPLESRVGVLECKLRNADAQIESAERALEMAVPGLPFDPGKPFTGILELGARLRAAEARTAWQPIETAPVGVEVLVTRYTSGGILLGGPTHWMPLPAAPEAP